PPFPAGRRARRAATPRPQPRTVRRGILRMHPPGKRGPSIIALRDPFAKLDAGLTIDSGARQSDRCARRSREGEDMKTSSIVFAFALASSTAALANVKTDTIKVSGWKCEKCPAKTEAKLKQVNGVESASADREKSQVVVKYDDTQTKQAELEMAGSDQSYADTQ